MPSNLVSDLLLDRRTALKATLGLGLGAGLSGTTALPALAAGKQSRMNYADPADHLYAFGKIWAGYDKPVIRAFHGLMYLRVRGKRMVPLFGYTGTSALLARIDQSQDLWIKSRETGYLTDLRSGDILESWQNPFTRRKVPVYHFYNNVLVGKLGKEIPKLFFGVEGDSPTLMNEGTAFPDSFGRYPFILPFEAYGDDMLLSWDYTHDYINPVTPEGWPRSSTGRRTTPSEHFTFNFSRSELENRDLPTVRVIAGFTQVSESWPFMQMGSTEFAGATLFGRMFSHKGLKGLDDVPRRLRAYIEKHAPEYLTVPEGWEPDDSRVDTWKAYSQDIPPENPGYAWKPPAFKVPTGSGRRQ
jgi:hypothetical protein